MCSRAHACSVGHASCSSTQRGSGSHPEKTNQHVGMRTQNAHTFTTSAMHVRSGALNQIRQTAAGILQHHHLPARFTVAAVATRSKDKGEGGSSHSYAVPSPAPVRPSPPLLATSSSSLVWWWCCCCCPPPSSGRAARPSRSSSPSMCRAALAAAVHTDNTRERERKRYCDREIERKRWRDGAYCNTIFYCTAAARSVPTQPSNKQVNQIDCTFCDQQHTPSCFPATSLTSTTLSN